MYVMLYDWDLMRRIASLFSANMRSKFILSPHDFKTEPYREVDARTFITASVCRRSFSTCDHSDLIAAPRFLVEAENLSVMPLFPGPLNDAWRGLTSAMLGAGKFNHPVTISALSPLSKRIVICTGDSGKNSQRGYLSDSDSYSLNFQSSG